MVLHGAFFKLVLAWPMSIVLLLQILFRRGKPITGQIGGVPNGSFSSILCEFHPGVVLGWVRRKVIKAVFSQLAIESSRSLFDYMGA